MDKSYCLYLLGLAAFSLLSPSMHIQRYTKRYNKSYKAQYCLCATLASAAAFLPQE